MAQDLYSSWIGRLVSVLIQIIVVLAALAAIITFVRSYWIPATRLVADIYPMEFRLPVDGGELTAATRSNQPMDPAIAHVLAVTNANGFARIDLKNEGTLPIERINIRVRGAVIYAKGTPNVQDSVVIPISDESGITVPKLTQGGFITIYVWSGIAWGTYSSWDTLEDQFQITFPQGVADERFHITVGGLSEFIDKHFLIFLNAFGILFLLSTAGLVVRVFRFGQDQTPGNSQPGSIEIAFRPSAPYEETKVSHQRVLSTVRIGLANSGGAPLANCKLYIDSISPEPTLPGGLPILLDGAGFTLRHDDPEKLVDIASHWDHVDKFRFNSPSHAFADPLLFIDDRLSRTFSVKIAATGYQRGASCRLSTDETKALHLQFLGYVS
jgi:hypothetical protein